ncbi:MAG: GTP 3',8-cyclase MoaA [Bacteroidetes bacterium]|nr:GTP 3',8-cyclase MoaA [Bacteroidota bacterium]
MITDSFGRIHHYLRVSLTPACNLRCSYCAPADGFRVPPGTKQFSRSEITRVIGWLAGMGVTKVRFTGGEPTLRSDLAGLIHDTHSTAGISTVGLTTNGVLLGLQLDEYLKAGLSSVNISLDTLRPDRFMAISKRPWHQQVMTGIRKAIDCGRLQVKLNMVVQRGVNEDEVVDMIHFFARDPVELRFIELMPFAGNGWDPQAGIPSQELLKKIRQSVDLATIEQSTAGHVSDQWAVKGSALKLGFISSVSNAFCGTCSRIRLTADGKFKSCLFDDGELDVLSPLRAGCTREEFHTLIRTHMLKKPAAHGGHDFSKSTTHRSMISIGG